MKRKEIEALAERLLARSTSKLSSYGPQLRQDLHESRQAPALGRAEGRCTAAMVVYGHRVPTARPDRTYLRSALMAYPLNPLKHNEGRAN
jgi:hypothetical protein